MIDRAPIKAQFETLAPHLDERARRLFASTEARAAGRGGIAAVCRLDENSYPKPIKISDAQISAINIQHDAFHGEWNYTIAPIRQLVSEATTAGTSDDR